MTDESHKVRLLRDDGSAFEGILSASFDGENCRLTLAIGQDVYTETASDYFEAMQGVRSRLENKGIRLNCYGASKNVWSSGMSRSMGGGEMGYRLTLGKKPTEADLVGIFECDPALIPATVAEQSSFYDEWLESVGFKQPRSSLIMRVKESWFMCLLLIVLAFLTAFHFWNLR